VEDSVDLGRINSALFQPSLTGYPHGAGHTCAAGNGPLIFTPMRILVVEDDKKIASFVINGLKQSGYAVDHASEGEDGLARAQTIAYDAVVVDLMLPKLEGLGLIQNCGREAAGCRCSS
jgi:PleD family two-component response regulator